MANWGRRPITDAGKAKTAPPEITYYYDGEERLDRRPLGRVERFVDPQGNVMSLQIGADGDPQKMMTMDRKRMEYRRDGFVEHAKCPLRHGTHLMAGAIGKDFSALPVDMREPCEHDPRTLVKQGHDLHAQNGCVHIEWLIKHRVDKEKAQNAKRNATRVAQEAREAKRRKLEDLQLTKAEAEMGLVSDEPTDPAPRRRKRNPDETPE